MIKLVSTDTSIHQEHALVMYLYDCYIKNKEVIIDFHLEGPCCHSNQLYVILDSFCQKTNFNPQRITILTANMLETHPQYNIIHKPEYWYELELIKKWTLTNTVDSGIEPTKHFGIFVGRSTWARAWVSAILYRHSEKVLQTFHSGYNKNYVVPKSSGVVDSIGLDDLNQFGCDIIPEVAEFLAQCPVVDYDDINKIKHTKMFISPNNDSCYPIQHPANLNILKWYNDIFVDVVCETRVVGNVFFVSEKTWRCMVARKPFIIVGPGNFLKNLRRLGFKTFNNFWDEGYDDYSSEHRIKEIERLINSLAIKSIDEMSALQQQMQSVLDHNLDTFNKLTYQQIRETFNE